MRSIINLILVIMEILAGIAGMLVSLQLSQHFLGERHVYFGIIPAYLFIHIIVDAKYWVMDWLDDHMEEAA